jgi:hypothetical protein
VVGGLPVFFSLVACKFYQLIGWGQIKEFPIAPHFYPICFGKCCTPFTYIVGSKGRNVYFKIEPSILESVHSFIFSEWWANQIDSLQKKIELERHLI